MSTTEANWTTKTINVEFDSTFTDHYSSTRAVYINSWTSAAGKASLVTSTGKAQILKGATNYQIVVLKADAQPLVIGDEGNWDTVVEKNSADKAAPTTKITAYYAANRIIAGNDDESVVTTAYTVKFVVNNDVGDGYGVYVAGDFNSWKISSEWRLDYNTITSKWEGSFELLAGAIQYKFVRAKYDDASKENKWEKDLPTTSKNHEHTVAANVTLDAVTVDFQD